MFMTSSRYVYHITDWGRTGRTIGVLVGVTIALVTFHAFFCLLARLPAIIRMVGMIIIQQRQRGLEELSEVKDRPREQSDSVLAQSWPFVKFCHL